MRAYKTLTRELLTLAAGRFVARAFRKRCPACPQQPPAVSQHLAQLAPPGQRYGYDLLVWVGLARYQRRLQRSEIQVALAQRGLTLSSASISALCDRFLTALEALHWQAAPALRSVLAHGYALHLDATCERGRGGLFVCLDGLTGWVLHAVRIDTENERALRPAVTRTLAAFGPLLATMRDLGSAMAKTFAACCPRNCPDLLCHFHFLAAVGKRLLAADYAALRSQLRSRLQALLHQAQRPAADLRPELPALLLWLLEGAAHKQPSFPFALPLLDFYRRCAQFPSQCDQRLPLPRSACEQDLLRRVASAWHDFQALQQPAAAVRRLTHRQALFCELRDILRLSPRDLPHGQGPRPEPLSPTAQATRLRAIAAACQRHHHSLRQRVRKLPARAAEQPPAAILLDYLERYAAQLCGQPVLHDQQGRVVAVVARTNNVLEQFFARAKQSLRRRVGRAHLSRDMQDQPAQVALVANLRQPASRPSPLQRDNSHAALRRRNRIWAAQATQSPPPAQPLAA